MTEKSTDASSTGIISALTYAMFFMFAMTTDAVGEIIKVAKGDMSLTNTQASLFHFAPMVAIALSGVLLGFLADRFGRKRTIILGLGIYGVASLLFMSGHQFYFFLSLLFVSGLAIGVFKTAALALIGDITNSTEHHTRKMNLVEGFFGLGAIVGPLIVVSLTAHGISWTWLYVLAAAWCGVMIVAAMLVKFPPFTPAAREQAGLTSTLSLLRNKYAMGFSLAIAMYVACEVAIFVWLPTFLAGYTGTELAVFVAAYAVTIFFILRALGRFLGVWILRKFDWKLVMAGFSGLIFACFLGSSILGKSAALYLLPLSGLFMSMIYPTLNSKGISCLPKDQHGAVAGLLLFFTAFAAAVGPMAMALVSDTLGAGDVQTGFYLATVFAATLFGFMIWNVMTDPAGQILADANTSEYGPK